MPVMNKLSQIWRRLLFYVRRDQFDRELEEEMRFHLELKAQENAEAGMEPLEARMPPSGNSAIKHYFGR